jgi:hypothetical protein
MQRELRQVTAALLPSTIPGVVDEDVAHYPRGGGEKVGPRLPPRPALIDELEVCLVDKRCRVERLITVPAPALPVGDFSQFRVKERDQLIERSAVTPLQFIEEPSNLFSGRLFHEPRSPGVLHEPRVISDVLFVEYASGWPRPQRTIELLWQADSSDIRHTCHWQTS